MSLAKMYLGTKIVKAMPMKRDEYNALRGWTVPADENPEDMGYLVEYMDGGKANHPQFDGYISWSPADVFEKAYSEITDDQIKMVESVAEIAGPGDPSPYLTFGQAIELLKAGIKVARIGWNGKGMWLELVGYTGECHNVYPIRPWIGMKTADNEFVPWVASQSDLLVEDWVLVEV